MTCELDECKIGVLEYQPGDQIVLMHPGHLSETACVRLKEGAAKLFSGAVIVIIEEGMDIKVVRKTNDEGQANGGADKSDS